MGLLRPMTPSIAPKPRRISQAALNRAGATSEAVSYNYPIKPPELFPGVVPAGVQPRVAMDSAAYAYAQGAYQDSMGFPGYQALAFLATRAEFRAFAAALSTELTREWITLSSSETAGTSSKHKVTELTQELTRYGVQHAIQLAAEHDCYYGRGQIYIDIKGQDRNAPLIVDKRTIKVGSLNGIKNIEPMWTTPALYNALDPIAPDFYRPSKWFMLGQQVDASRLLTVVTRPLPDMLKPAFNFSGMSLSQLAEPYVDNWLRTRQSVSDLLNNFSITALQTSMDQVLEGGDGEDVFARAELFRAQRTNLGLMLLDKDREALVQLNVPLSGLDQLQAQSQEHMCSVARMPAIVLTGISPSGLNASSEGEIRTWYDWIAAQQESYWRAPIETILNVIQISKYGEIDPDITFSFSPLFQLTGKELAEIRLANSTSAGNYLDRNVISPEEERERLARDPNSGYNGIDITEVPEEAESDASPD